MMIGRRQFLAVNLTWPLYARSMAAAPQEQQHAPQPVTKPGRHPLKLEYGRDASSHQAGGVRVVHGEVVFRPLSSAFQHASG